MASTKLVTDSELSYIFDRQNHSVIYDENYYFFLSFSSIRFFEKPYIAQIDLLVLRKIPFSSQKYKKLIH